MVVGYVIGKPRLLRQRQMQLPMPVHRYVGLVAVLLEKHPAQHVGLVPRVRWKKRGIAGKEIKNRARLRQHPAVIENDCRDLSDRVDRAEFGARRLAAILRRIDPATGDAELGQEQSYLVDIAGVEVAIEREHRVHLLGWLQVRSHRLKRTARGRGRPTNSLL